MPQPTWMTVILETGFFTAEERTIGSMANVTHGVLQIWVNLHLISNQETNWAMKLSSIWTLWWQNTVCALWLSLLMWSSTRTRVENLNKHDAGTAIISLILFYASSIWIVKSHFCSSCCCHSLYIQLTIRISVSTNCHKFFQRQQKRQGKEKNIINTIYCKFLFVKQLANNRVGWRTMVEALCLSRGKED